MNLIAAISLGLLGSFHCIGMCGPIALSLPAKGNSFLQRIFSVLVYNSGRVITYTMLGLLAGAIGRSFALEGLQQPLSVTLGLLILLFVFIPHKYTSRISFTKPVYLIISRIKSSLVDLFKKRSYISLLLIGFLNGLLPCGLVYMALAGALATTGIMSGALFMIFFGLGTIPLMLTVNISKEIIPLKIRGNLNKVVPYFISIMAFLLILRGLNLGIPYVSPRIDTQTSSFASCHSETAPCCHKR